MAPTVNSACNVMLQIKNSKNIVDRCNLSNSQVAKQKCIDVISVILASFRFTIPSILLFYIC